LVPISRIQRESNVYFGYERIPASEKPLRVQEHFSSVARRYDLMNTVLSLGIHHLWKGAAVEMMDLRPGEEVLDACAGTGDLAARAARAVGSTGRVVLLDFNEAMLEAGRRKPELIRPGAPLQFVRGDAQALPFRDGAFNAVMIGFGIRNLTHMDAGLRELFRVTASGGRMMCLEFSWPEASWLGKLYDFYSLRVMPFLGEVLAGNRQGYRHLPESIRTFEPPYVLRKAMQKAGFRMATSRRFTKGIAALHLARKD